MQLSYDDSGLMAKIRLANKLDELLENLGRDAAAFFRFKLVHETLNKPKRSQPGIEENGRFIRNLSGNLRRAQSDPKEVKPFTYMVEYVDGQSGVRYGVKVANYSTDQYGADYYELTGKKYGDFIQTKIRKEHGRFVHSLRRGVKYEYRNPFD